MKKIMMVCLFSLLFLSGFNQSNRVDSLKALYYQQKDVANNNQEKIIIKDNNPGEVTIIEEESITKLNNYYLKNPIKPEGYRVQLYSGSREEIQEIKNKFSGSYSGINTYSTYLAPNFRIRVGDFRTKMEAEKFKAQIQNEFSGCYVIKDKIELPRLE
jgi:SPOR domain